MPRVKRGSKRRSSRKKTLALAKGFFLTKSKLHRAAQEAGEKSLKYGYVGRKLKKRDFRSLWIVRIGAGARLADLCLICKTFGAPGQASRVVFRDAYADGDLWVERRDGVPAYQGRQIAPARRARRRAHVFVREVHPADDGARSVESTPRLRRSYSARAAKFAGKIFGGVSWGLGGLQPLEIPRNRQTNVWKNLDERS